MRIISVMTAVFSGWLCAGAAAQQAASPAQSRQFGGWALNCQRADATVAMCELIQSIMDAQQRLVFRLAVGNKTPQDKNVSAVAQLPVNVSFSESPKLKFGSQSISLTYRSCAAGGCIAEAVMPPAIFNVLLEKGSVGGSIEFRDATNRVIQFPLSSNGFSQAWPAYVSASVSATKRP